MFLGIDHTVGCPGVMDSVVSSKIVGTVDSGQQQLCYLSLRFPLRLIASSLTYRCGSPLERFSRLLLSEV